MEYYHTDENVLVINTYLAKVVVDLKKVLVKDLIADCKKHAVWRYYLCKMGEIGILRVGRRYMVQFRANATSDSIVLDLADDLTLTQLKKMFKAN